MGCGKRLTARIREGPCGLEGTGDSGKTIPGPAGRGGRFLLRGEVVNGQPAVVWRHTAFWGYAGTRPRAGIDRRREARSADPDSAGIGPGGAMGRRGGLHAQEAVSGIGGPCGR